MIITVTPNPVSIERRPWSTPLIRGEVHRTGAVTTEPSGKGSQCRSALTSPVLTH